MSYHRWTGSCVTGAAGDPSEKKKKKKKGIILGLTASL